MSNDVVSSNETPTKWERIGCASASSIEDIRLCFANYCEILNIHLPNIEELIMSYIKIVKVQMKSICTGYYIHGTSKRKKRFNHYNFRESKSGDTFIPHSFETSQSSAIIPAITHLGRHFITYQIFCKDGKKIGYDIPKENFDLRVLDLKATPLGRQYTHRELVEYLSYRPS
jgi:hypothetical protein